MPAFDYTSRDYYSIKEDLITRANALPIGQDWTSRSSSDFGMMMVELWAYMGDILHFYVDRAAAETYIGTATQRESLIALANLFDYEYAPLRSATATVTLTPTTTPTSTITIPINTGFVALARTSSENTVYFVTTQSASMGASTTSVTIPLVEGKVEVDESPIHMISSNGNVSTGAPNQKFSLRYTGVIPSSVSVYVYEGSVVNGSPTSVEYRYVPRFVDLSSSDRAFTVTTAADGLVQIVFGNGVNGKIPNNGAQVKVTYRRSLGSLGNIEANRINSFANTTIAGVTIASSTASTGAYDDESITSLKANIPLLFRTQDRAVSLQDFKDLSLRIPGVVKATATNVGALVTIYPLDQQSNYLSPTFGSTITINTDLKNETIEYFEPRLLLGASVQAASSVALTDVYISASIQVLDGYVQRWVADAVTEKLNTFFEFDNVYFGQTLSLGEVYRAIMSVDGVDYANITVFNTTNSGFAANNRITAGPASLLKKAADYTFTVTGGVSG